MKDMNKQNAIRRVRRALTVDGAMTFDHAMLPTAVIDVAGNMRGKTLDHAYTTHQGLQARGVKTVDSTGAFLVGELERLDQTIHMPLASVSWGRDIDVREDVSLADEMSSFTLTTFGSAGGLGTGQGIGNGKAWIAKSTNQVTGVGVDSGKYPQPLTPWGVEIKYSLLELESAAKMGRPIDDQKIEGMRLKHQMDIDEQVYFGDTTLNQKGLINSPLVTNVSNVPAGAGGTTPWNTKTPDEILADVNAILTTTWGNSAWAEMPNRLLLPPGQFGYIATAKVSSAGNVSILKYILENNVLTASGQGQLTIAPVKWLQGAGAGGTIGVPGTGDRMVAYTKEKKYVRFPLVPLQRTPVQYLSIYHAFTYYCRLGVVEVVYPETLGYRDGI